MLNKSLFILLSLSLLAAASGQASQWQKSSDYALTAFNHDSGGHGGPPPGMEPRTAEERLDKLEDVLGLSQDQMDRMLPILEDQKAAEQADMDAMRQSGERPDRTAMEKMEARREARIRGTRDAFADILTPEQLSEYDDLLSQEQEEREQHRPGPPPGGGGGPGGRG